MYGARFIVPSLTSLGGDNKQHSSEVCHHLKRFIFFTFWKRILHQTSQFAMVYIEIIGTKCRRQYDNTPDGGLIVL